MVIRPLLLLLACCGDNLPVDDGFGEPCESISGQLYTECETETSTIGICAIGVCRRFCEGSEEDLRACPPGQRAIPTVANLCWCEP